MNKLSEFLNELGVKKVYFCAGARNSHLIERLSFFEQFFSLDERSTAFMALGHAKLSKTPVAICVTSGTAVAECLPAFIEAYYSHIPLIVISADRPKRLHNTFAPQTIKQSGIFSDFSRFEFNGIEAEISLTTISYPMHLNIYIDELKETYERASGVISLNDFQQLLNAKKNPIAIFTESTKDCEKEFHYLNEMNFPIHMECTSQLASLNIKNAILYERTLVDRFKKNEIDLIIKFGGTPLTKLWRLLDSNEHEVDIISYKNDKIGLSYGYVLNEDLVYAANIQNKTFENFIEMDLNSLLEELPRSEAAIIKNIIEKIDVNDLVFVGNSMPIRYMQLLNHLKHRNQVYAARGANGIDGQISMAIGISHATEKNVHCLIGDLTFLYDLGICATKLPSNLFIHVINNKGGRIFEQIDVHPKMILEHTYSIKNMIKGFISQNQIKEYIPNQKQTKEFWQYWK